MAIMAYAERHGVQQINQLPGCWEFQPGEGWFVAVNGHNTPAQCSHGTEVPPFHAYIAWNEFPAGIIGPTDGVLAAGSVANESSLLSALRADGAAS